MGTVGHFGWPVKMVGESCFYVLGGWGSVDIHYSEWGCMGESGAGHSF